MSFRCSICKKFKFISCVCKTHEKDVWTISMPINTTRVISAEELKACRTNNELEKLLEIRGFTNFKKQQQL